MKQFSSRTEKEELDDDDGNLSEPTNIVVVKEFYVNAMVEEGSIPPYTSYVRGKTMPFNAATINFFLGIDEEDAPCEYIQYINGRYNHEDIERVVCMSGGTFVRNRQHLQLHIKRTNLNSLAQI